MMVMMFLIEVGVKFYSGFGVRVIIIKQVMMMLWTAKLSQNWRMQTRSR